MLNAQFTILSYLSINRLARLNLYINFNTTECFSLTEFSAILWKRLTSHTKMKTCQVSYHIRNVHRLRFLRNVVLITSAISIKSGSRSESVVSDISQFRSTP
jgi:hypothetical protein